MDDIFAALKKKDLEALDRALAAPGADPNKRRSNDDELAIAIAVKDDDHDMVELLLKYGADPSRERYPKRVVELVESRKVGLMILDRLQKLDRLSPEELIELSFRFDDESRIHRIAANAAENCDLGISSELLKSAFHLEGKYVKAIIEPGINPNVLFNTNSDTSIFPCGIALPERQSLLLQLVASAGQFSTAYIPEYRETLVSFTKYLLEKGASPNWPFNFPPLAAAALSNDPEVSSLLLSYGANPGFLIEYVDLNVMNRFDEIVRSLQGSAASGHWNLDADIIRIGRGLHTQSYPAPLHSALLAGSSVVFEIIASFHPNFDDLWCGMTVAEHAYLLV